ncbi:MAG TPA: hypothetical protein VK709_03735 [Candidatus Saccharimonadales bacterium]|jgi:hypothetical protein|nr:hypothetical protein [Candidatus Saccharimonadales bacterium]
MDRLAYTLLTMALFLSADSSGALRPIIPNDFSNLASVDNAADPQGSTTPSDSQQKSKKSKSADPASDSTASPSTKGPDGTLQPMSRLSLVRYVDGEIVQVVRPIPAGKKGFHMKAGVPLNDNALRMAVTSAGAAINPGDRAQITDLNFKDKEIIVDINGGGKGKTRLRDRIHLEIGGVPTASTTPETAVNTNAGATIYLDFDKPLPEMSAEDLEKLLSSVLDFSKRHSAAVQWVDTLPPDIQKAIQEKQPVIGMDHDMVLAAMGRPDKKIREKGPDGNEIEDWIYGKPPEKTIFVSFEGDKVTKVHQYPQ